MCASLSSPQRTIQPPVLLSSTIPTHQLSQHPYKLQMQLRKEFVISHHLRQASSSHPSGPILSRIPIRICRPPSQEGRHRDAVLLSNVFMITSVSFTFFDFLCSPRDDITCNASKMLPDERHYLIRSSLAASECYECVFTITAAGIRVGKTEFVCNGPAV